MSFQDKNVTCSECLQPFTFSAENQQVSSELEYDRPARCRSCWLAREEQRRGEGDSYHTPTRPVPRGFAQPTEATANLRGRHGA
jgi:Zn-finger nucleic acid-binding protein